MRLACNLVRFGSACLRIKNQELTQRRQGADSSTPKSTIGFGHQNLVAMTFAFGDHDELQCARSGISNAMRISRRDVKGLGRLKFDGLVANLHGRFSPQDIKELLSLMMKMQQSLLLGGISSWMTVNLGFFRRNQALHSSPQLYCTAFIVETGVRVDGCDSFK
jgi:hypothetical protein